MRTDQWGRLKVQSLSSVQIRGRCIIFLSGQTEQIGFELNFGLERELSDAAGCEARNGTQAISDRNLIPMLRALFRGLSFFRHLAFKGGGNQLRIAGIIQSLRNDSMRGQEALYFPRDFFRSGIMYDIELLRLPRPRKEGAHQAINGQVFSRNKRLNRSHPGRPPQENREKVDGSIRMQDHTLLRAEFSRTNPGIRLRQATGNQFRNPSNFRLTGHTQILEIAAIFNCQFKIQFPWRFRISLWSLLPGTGDRDRNRQNRCNISPNLRQKNHATPLKSQRTTIVNNCYRESY
ncbi:MAG: hypothetical protein NXI24_11110 [bacterium]|nr:hypothetical protein [bacterium]